MTTTKRSSARTRGLRIAAKVATVGGLAIAALGLVEAHAAASAGAPAAAAAPIGETPSIDDTQPLPMEGLVKSGRGGNCGCAPCWGPPAPPARSTARGRRARTKGAAAGKRGAPRERGTRSKRGSR